MIKLLADENVPVEAVETLKSRGLDILSITAFSQGLNYREVLDIANRENRILVTFDKDFGELVVKEKIKVKGLIMLRFTPKSPREVANRIWQILTLKIPMENNLLVVKDYTVKAVKLKF